MPRNAQNEHHWHTIAQHYELEAGPINLENGYFGRMSRAVRTQCLENVGFINRSNSVNVRQQFGRSENVERRRQLAGLSDAEPEYFAYTRTATETL
ncbi:class V aminotransferase, partial [Corynebacterium propinquum]